MATPARADDGELPTIDSVHPPMIQVGDMQRAARVERIAVDVRAANVSWITIEIAALRRGRVVLPVSVPAGTRIVGMAVNASGERGWSAARSQSQALADARRDSDTSLLAWEGTSNEHHHVRIEVEGTARIELAVELPPLRALAIDAEGRTVGRIEAMIEGRPSREWRKPARAVELDLRGIEGYVKTDAYPHAGPETWLVVGAPNREERSFERRFGAIPSGFWSNKPQIRRMMKLNRERMTYCYERIAQYRGEIEGEVLLQFLIGSDGTVLDVSSTSTLPVEITSCIEGVVKAWPFGPIETVTQVNYPLRFSTWK